MAGYHLKTIPRGIVGEPSKILEEFQEFEDSLEQGSRLMALQELSDMVGAIEAYLEKHEPTFTLEDLKVMSTITKRVFRSGARKSNE